MSKIASSAFVAFGSLSLSWGRLRSLRESRVMRVMRFVRPHKKGPPVMAGLFNAATHVLPASYLLVRPTGVVGRDERFQVPRLFAQVHHHIMVCHHVDFLRGDEVFRRAVGFGAHRDSPFVIRLDTLRVFVSAIQVQMQPELERLEDVHRENGGRTRRCTVNCRGAGCFRCLFLSHRVSVFVVGFRPRQRRELCRSASRFRARAPKENQRPAYQCGPLAPSLPGSLWRCVSIAPAAPCLSPGGTSSRGCKCARALPRQRETNATAEQRRCSQRVGAAWFDRS